MALFALNQPIQTSTPTVTVDNKLSPGVHTFQLVVVDDLGRKSDPASATVTVVGTVLVGGPGGVRPAPAIAQVMAGGKAVPQAKAGAGATSTTGQKAGTAKQAQPPGRGKSASSTSGKSTKAKKKSTAKKPSTKKRS